jgi:hypothetical protein
MAIGAAACGHAEPTRATDVHGWSPVPGIATAFTLTCGADGSTSVSDDAVQTQPDGVHLSVVNEYDEPVSVGGLDADPGATTWTLTEPPRAFHLSCWPFSEHGSGDEPPGTSLDIVDPAGLYVPRELECSGESMGGGPDLGEAPAENGPPPLHAARRSIRGLRPDDIVRIVGYPEQDDAPVAVIRDGEVIARYGFVRFEDQPWAIAGGVVCAGVGLKLRGRDSNQYETRTSR